MRTKHLTITTLALLFLVAIISCQDEIQEVLQQKSIEIEETQAWYELTNPISSDLKSANFNSGKLPVHPDWDHAFT